jgi:hypothetical protein
VFRSATHGLSEMLRCKIMLANGRQIS